MPYESPAAKLARLRSEQSAPMRLEDALRLHNDRGTQTIPDWSFRGKLADEPEADDVSITQTDELPDPDQRPSLQTTHDYYQYYYRLSEEEQLSLRGHWEDGGNEGDFRAAIDKHIKQQGVTEASGVTLAGTNQPMSDDIDVLLDELISTQGLPYSPQVAAYEQQLAKRINALDPPIKLDESIDP